MNTIQRIFKNTGLLFIANIINKIFGFFFYIYCSLFRSRRFWNFIFALAFTGIFGVFSDLGLQQLTVRKVARDKSLTIGYLRNQGYNNERI